MLCEDVMKHFVDNVNTTGWLLLKLKKKSVLHSPSSSLQLLTQTSEQSTMISTHSSNWLLNITDMECIDCGMQNESLNKIKVDFRNCNYLNILTQKRQVPNLI